MRTNTLNSRKSAASKKFEAEIQDLVWEHKDGEFGRERRWTIGCPAVFGFACLEFVDLVAFWILDANIVWALATTIVLLGLEFTGWHGRRWIRIFRSDGLLE